MTSPRLMRAAGRAKVRVRLSVVLERALDDAIAYASARAFKHRDTPIETPEELVAAMDEHLPCAFWNAIAELGLAIE